MLSKAEVAILDALCSGQEATAQELVTETGYSRKQVYRVVDEFLESGLLDERRSHHNQRVVRATDAPVVEAYRRLTSKLGHVEWTELLSPATMRVCWYLDEPRRVTTVADRLDVSRQAVHDALSPLKDRAMLDPTGPAYALSSDLQPLHEFVQAVVTHEHRTRVRSLAPSAIVEWCDPKRALVRAQNLEDTDAIRKTGEWCVTGLAGFEAYGLQFFLAGEPAFWYAPDDDLTPEELVCHTLVLDSDSRRASYAMLLVEQAGIEQGALTETANWYGLETMIPRMYRLIDEGSDSVDASGDMAANGVRLPSYREYAALKDQYGVA